MRRTIFPRFFTTTTLLKPANVSQTTENYCDKLDTRIVQCDCNLLCHIGRDMISEFWSSKIVSGGFFPHHKPLGGQSIEVLLQSVVAKANLTKESAEVLIYRP